MIERFDHFMARANAAYYAARDPFADFVTAPEISQVFGEIIGGWARIAWEMMGAPRDIMLVEAGPGSGVLMADALRAARVMPGFHRALDVHLVETSEPLAALQSQALSSRGVPLTWHSHWETIPQGPVIIIANEFFDALPVAHYIYGARGWYERLIGLSPEGQLVFGLAGEPSGEIEMHAEPGTILEVGFAAREMMTKIAAHLSHVPGALLAIDYGPASFQFGASLQAVKNHRFADPLRDPGEADLTAYIDFAGLKQAAQKAGAVTYGPISQGLFLQRLGIFERAQKLSQNADAQQKQAIVHALDRLARPGPCNGERASMAELFKVLAVTSPGLSKLPGFEADCT